MDYYTFGLPDQTKLDFVYEFRIMDKHIYLKGDYVGKDQVGEPHHPEQALWLNSLKNKIAISEVWYGCWQLDTEADLENFIDILKKSKVLVTFSIDYEISGHFDKDEQGWCSDRLSLVCIDGKNVKIRRYYDANGIIRSDYTQDATIEQKEGQKIYLKYKENTSKVVLDLETQRLI